MERALPLSLHSQSMDPELNRARHGSLPGRQSETRLHWALTHPVRLGFGQGAHATQDLGSNARPLSEIHSKPLCKVTGVLENRDSSELEGPDVKISYKSSRGVSKRALQKNCADRIQTTLALI